MVEEAGGGGEGEGGGGDGTEPQGFSQAEHIVQAIWYLDVTDGFATGRIRRRIEIHTDNLSVLSILGKFSDTLLTNQRERERECRRRKRKCGKADDEDE